MKRLMLSAALVYAAYSVSAVPTCVFASDYDFVNVSTGDVIEFQSDGVYLNDTLITKHYGGLDCEIDVYVGRDTVRFYAAVGDDPTVSRYSKNWSFYRKRDLMVLYDEKGGCWLALNKKSKRKKQ